MKPGGEPVGPETKIAHDGRILLRNPTLITIPVVILGVLLSGWVGLLLRNAEQRDILSDFQNDVEVRANSIYREVANNFEALRTLGALFAGDTIPDAEVFGLQAREILSRHNDIQALEWIPRVPHPERASYVSGMRAKFRDFKFTERQKQGTMVTASMRPEYFPVYYVEPFAGNEAALGYDLASNPSRLEALEASRDNGEPRATAGITLVQEKGNQSGFLAFLPIYEGFPSTVAQRRQSLLGFVLGVYRMGDIYRRATRYEGALDLAITLVDKSSSAGDDRLHVQEPHAGSAVRTDITYEQAMPDIWGRKWSLVASPTTSYLAARTSYLPLVAFVSGSIFTLFIAALIHTISRRAETIRKVVVERTTALNRANEMLEATSRTDALTGIANRRHLDDRLGREWLRAIRNRSPISFILIDIDFFKSYNDEYGHLRGDKCLQKVAATLASAARRPGDVVARYGGEEFCLVLPDTANAEVVANTCRRSIEELRIPHELSGVAKVVTVSIGFSTVVPRQGTDPSRVVQAADHALYRAKDAGRNRVEETAAESNHRGRGGPWG